MTGFDAGQACAQKEVCVKLKERTEMKERERRKTE